MKRISLLPLFGLLLLTFTPGCINFRVSADDDPVVKISGLGTAYAGYSGIDEWDGNILNLGLFSGTARKGEFFSLDIWPLGGFGVGIAGARVRVLPFEMGAGVLFYQPKLPGKKHDDPVENLPEIDDERRREPRTAVEEEIEEVEGEEIEEEMVEEEIVEEEIEEEEIVEQETNKKKATNKKNTKKGKNTKKDN